MTGKWCLKSIVSLETVADPSPTLQSENQDTPSGEEPIDVTTKDPFQELTENSFTFDYEDMTHPTVMGEDEGEATTELASAALATLHAPLSTQWPQSLVNASYRLGVLFLLLFVITNCNQKLNIFRSTVSYVYLHCKLVEDKPSFFLCSIPVLKYDILAQSYKQVFSNNYNNFCNVFF